MRRNKRVLGLGLTCCGLILGSTPASIPSPEVGTSATYNVRQYGVKGTARRVLDGVMDAGSNELTSGTANFAPSDVGQPITVLGAESASTPIGVVPGAPLTSTITQWVSATTVKLANSAMVSVSGASVSWGPDDRNAIELLIEKVGSSGGGTLYFPCGTYRFSSTQPLSVFYNNVRLTGEGDCSVLYNSLVRFSACRGASCPVRQSNPATTYTNQMGFSVLYVGSHSLVENVEIDHLTFQDNGQDYNYSVWGPNGPGVLGTSSLAPDQLNQVYLHDNTIHTDYLVGITTNASSDSIYIYNNTILSSANHCVYAAGAPKTNISIIGNKCQGTSYPMRGGIDYKQGAHVLIADNDISNVAQHGIGIDASGAGEDTQDITISGNHIHDLNLWPRGASGPFNTHGIQLNDGTDVLIENNTISGANYSGIFVSADLSDISNVTIQNNVISKVGERGIWIAADKPNSCSPPSCPATVSNLTINGNQISTTPMGIYLQNVTGENYLSGNLVQGNGAKPAGPGSCGVAYNLVPLPSSRTIFTGNAGVRCAVNNFINIESLTEVYQMNSLK